MSKGKSRGAGGQGGRGALLVIVYVLLGGSVALAEDGALLTALKAVGLGWGRRYDIGFYVYVLLCLLTYFQFLLFKYCVI